MKKASIIALLEIIFLIILSILNIFIFNIDSYYVITFALVIFCVISYFFLGFEKSNYLNKKNSAFLIFKYFVIYIIVTYVAGLATGFLKNGYSLNPTMIIKNSFPYLLIILSREMFRYIYYNKAKNSKLLIILGYIFLVLIDVNLNIHHYDISLTSGLTKMVCLVVFPSIAKNILLTYLTIRVGYENAIFYSCIMELKQFIIPIFPDFGQYVGTIIEIAFPLWIMSGIDNEFKFNEKRRIPSSRYRSHNVLFYAIITFFLVIVVMLTSGYFKYYAVTIGSGSMTPNINKGDVVIVKTMKKENDYKEIKKGDVLVYDYDGKIIVHRVVEIKKLNEKTYYLTKGDYNISNDNYLVSNADVIGTVSFRIRYIGYPTVQLNERISKE